MSSQRGARHVPHLILVIVSAFLAGLRFVFQRGSSAAECGPHKPDGRRFESGPRFHHGFGNGIALALLCLPLAACAAKVTITNPDGSTVRMSEALYGHQLTTQAALQLSTASAKCFEAAGKISAAQPSENALSGPMMLSTCMAGGGQQQVQVPQFVAPPSFWDRVTQLAPAAIGIGQIVAADRASERATQAQLGLARINADERIATMGAFAGVSQAGYSALTSTAGAGYQALSTTAVAGYQANAATSAAGFQAIQTLGSDAFDASAQATGAWAATIAALPPTYQQGDGSMIVVGDGNTSQTGTGAIDQSQVGRDRDVTRTCTATSTASASGQSGATATGTTGPFASGGALGFYPQAPASIECGG